ncbi:hypothetical protein BCR44DRAFT_1514197, partial [Catenaria anguillulae PL171]
ISHFPTCASLTSLLASSPLPLLPPRPTPLVVPIRAASATAFQTAAARVAPRPQSIVWIAVRCATPVAATRSPKASYKNQAVSQCWRQG